MKFATCLLTDVPPPNRQLSYRRPARDERCRVGSNQPPSYRSRSTSRATERWRSWHCLQTDVLPPSLPPVQCCYLSVAPGLSRPALSQNLWYLCKLVNQSTLLHKDFSAKILWYSILFVIIKNAKIITLDEKSRELRTICVTIYTV